jgi:hypothetical protein
MSRDHNRTSKTEPPWVGPYEVMEVTQAKTLRLRDATGKMIAKAVNPEHVKRISAEAFDPTREVFIVEKIVDDRIVDGKKEYLVKWKYHAASENTWTKVVDFDDTHCISVYEQNKAALVRRAAAAATASALPAPSSSPLLQHSSPSRPLATASPLPEIAATPTPTTPTLPSAPSSSASLSQPIPIPVASSPHPSTVTRSGRKTVFPHHKK